MTQAWDRRLQVMRAQEEAARKQRIAEVAAANHHAAARASGLPTSWRWCPNGNGICTEIACTTACSPTVAGTR